MRVNSLARPLLASCLRRRLGGSRIELTSERDSPSIWPSNSGSRSGRRAASLATSCLRVGLLADGAQDRSHVPAGEPGGKLAGLLVHDLLDGGHFPAALIDRTLALCLSEDIPTQDVVILLSRLFTNPAARERSCGCCVKVPESPWPHRPGRSRR